MSRLYAAFLLGWIVKIFILKVFGGRAFGRCRPFFYGVITGEVLIFALWIAVGSVYFLSTGSRPEFLSVFLP
jgi:hypothetical protein